MDEDESVEGAHGVPGLIGQCPVIVACGGIHGEKASVAFDELFFESLFRHVPNLRGDFFAFGWTAFHDGPPRFLG